MEKFVTGLAAIGSAALLTACGSGVGLTAPTAPSVVAAANGTPPASGVAMASLLGTWTSERIITSSATISLSVCSNIQLNITTQTATLAAGTLSMQCPDGLAVSGNITGQLGGGVIPLTWTGTASQSGFPSCPFSLTGTGTPLGGEMFRLAYNGTTCLGQVQGSDDLRFASPSSPAPTPAPPPAPAPPPRSNHVGPGPLSADRAWDVVLATSREFPQLIRVFGTEEEAVSGATEMLLRTIWHLQLAGFQSARQRNPSGLISGDKLTIFVGGRWHVYDIYSFGTAGRASTVQFIEITGENPVPHPGIPD